MNTPDEQFTAILDAAVRIKNVKIN